MAETMKAAVVTAYGPPAFGDFPMPVADGDTVIVRPLAAAISGIDRAIVSGKHFLSPKTLPFIAGRDGVGRTEDGRLVYFDGTIAPYGSMAECIATTMAGLIEIPTLSDVALAAALGNAGAAAWLPLSWRAAIREGETVLILGAGGYVGGIAVQAARRLGAGRVVGVVRGAAQASRVSTLGADAVVDTGTRTDVAAALGAACPDGIDVFVDYLWGDVAAVAIRHAAVGARFVQVGTVAGDAATLSGEVLRGRSVDVLGYVSFRAPFELRAAVYRTMVALATSGELALAVVHYPLRDIGAAWNLANSEPPARAILHMNG